MVLVSSSLSCLINWYNFITSPFFIDGTPVQGNGHTVFFPLMLTNTVLFFFCSCLQCQCYNGLVLSTESTVALYGTVTPVPEGKQVNTPAAQHSSPAIRVPAHKVTWRNHVTQEIRQHVYMYCSNLVTVRSTYTCSKLVNRFL